jgi:hypothetical protein
MGSIPKNAKTNISPEFLSPIEMTKGKFLGYILYIPVVTTCGVVGIRITLVQWCGGGH